MKSIVKQKRWCACVGDTLFIGKHIRGSKTLHTLKSLLSNLYVSRQAHVILVDEYRYVRRWYSYEEAERILKLDKL